MFISPGEGQIDLITRRIRACLSRELYQASVEERKAFQMLPQLDRPRILDIGCERGVPTLEIAHLSSGQVIGLDIDEISLNECARKIKQEGLSK